ncbi:hypothetical protein [Streptomyces yerevanensis]|uniref:hypothetical protein n=1 Tax=Streptomyces yerevanensis TaxID=66378 RepID=UPI0005262FA3|nr:hypothetical protein [Streptomyces yerevanensis]
MDEEDPGHAVGGDHHSGPDHPFLQHRGQADDVRVVLAPRLDAHHPGLQFGPDTHRGPVRADQFRQPFRIPDPFHPQPRVRFLRSGRPRE